MRAILLSLLVLLTAADAAHARNSRPSSGRRLQYDHWLTCWGGSDAAVRRDPPFNRNTPEAELEKYRPEFRGAYSFTVKDTWQEWVTHSGNNCTQCGQTCTRSGSPPNETENCSCNYCSWQELETFYRPWSTQTVQWEALFEQDPAYRARRKEWLAKGKPEIARDASNLQELLQFDPDRPTNFHLFPGEGEVVQASNGGFLDALGGGETINLGIEIGDARHDYRGGIQLRVDGGRSGRQECDDVDHTMSAVIRAGTRVSGVTPNSIEFRKGWMELKQEADGTVHEEPAFFEVTDIGAQLYEGQNVFDNYKNTEVSLWLREINRAWWIDTSPTADAEISDNTSILKKDVNHEPGKPRVAVFQLNATELLRTPIFRSPFHLHPGKRYELCSQVYRANNIYYTQDAWWRPKPWSEERCAMFRLSETAPDLRSGGRKFRDFWTDWILPFPWW